MFAAVEAPHCDKCCQVNYMENAYEFGNYMKFYCEISCSQYGADQDSYNLELSNGKYCQTF